MTQQGGDDGSDPYELDPFGDAEYDPSLAFSFVSAKQARELLREAASYRDHAVQKWSERRNPVSRSALRSSEVLMQDLREAQVEVEMHHQEAVTLVETGRRDAVEFALAIDDSVRAFERLRRLHERLIHVTAMAGEEDPDLDAVPPAAPSTLLDTSTARGKLLSDMRSWLSSRMGSDAGEVLVARTTPGVGKTHAMMQLAYEHHMAGARVIYAVRTKETIRAPDGETYRRMLSRSPTGRMRLHVLHGRDETNCHRVEAVELAMAHGYSPGHTVCSRCEHYPDNHRVMGFAMCGYYESRIAAHRDSQAAKRGFNKQYPLILSSHGTLVSSLIIEGGRWGGGMRGPDLIFLDEDPTDALEVDVIIREDQVHFAAQSAETRPAEVFSAVLAKALEEAKTERKQVGAMGYRLSKSAPVNSHPIHTGYDTVYAGLDHHGLLHESTSKVARIMPQVPRLPQLLREVVSNTSFFAGAGELLSVKSAAEINAMDVPPKGLMTLAQAVGDEIRQSYRIRSLIYERLHGPIAGTAEGIELMEAHTEIDPMSYIARLECLPEDRDKGRDKDEWRFVVREQRPLADFRANIVIGDAYAQKAHYEQLLKRPVEMLTVTAQLHPDFDLTRILDARANITELRNGELGRVLSLAESQLHGQLQPGDRMLVYGHNELRPAVENWLQHTMAPKFGLSAWAYEHWWGGRGKDQYNGWEWVVCISDPVLSISGIRHVANARAFADSVRAKDPDEVLKHGIRCDLGDVRHGVIRGLRKSHWRIALEHDRMNVAETTQALHRPRPVNNPTRALTIGEMEMEPELVAQTQTIMPADYRKATDSAAAAKRESKKGTKSKRVEGTLDAFVTPDEAIAAMCAVVAHYGVYGPWFAHALVTAVSSVGFHAKSRSRPGQAVAGHMMDHGLIKGSIDRGPSSAIEAGERPIPAPEVPGGADLGAVVISGRSAGPGGSADPAGPPASDLAALPNPKSVIERVWHPPVFWQRLIEKASLPKAVKLAHQAIVKRDGLWTHTTARWPEWVGKGMMRGRKYPWFVYDPTLLPLDAALRVYYDIVDHQYGPVRGGQLWRPRARLDVPPSMSALPF